MDIYNRKQTDNSMGNSKNDGKTNKKGVKHISILNYLYIYITILIIA